MESVLHEVVCMLKSQSLGLKIKMLKIKRNGNSIQEKVLGQGDKKEEKKCVFIIVP